MRISGAPVRPDRHIVRHAAALFVCALLVAPSFANAEAEVSRADLSRAQERVAEAQKKIEASRSALTQGQQRLRKAERELGSIATSLRQMKVRERSLAQTLARVQGETNALAARIDAQKKSLARDARHAWMLGREQQLRLWLNADDPQAVARIARYYEYFEKDRAQRLGEFQLAGTELAALETRLRAEQAQLDTARAELKAREQEMTAAREERRQAVAGLAADLRSQKEELNQRKADAAALTRLFSNVREAFRDVPPEAVGAPLKQRKGKLRWPVNGRVAARFGSPLAEGKLTLNGVVIAAHEGSDVRAVHAGRVVFAEWLRGYGQLVILDHGDGYLSAYGYNQSLARAVGDWVKEGEAVATVGASGGHGSPGLYFEIRHSGEPQDPARWLRR
jgi:septal ring factor EnvC (AmiA/AmiB activator)